MKLNTIINGDSLEELKKIPDSSIDLIFADPPYWMRVEGSLTRVEGSEFDGCDDDWDKFDSLESYEDFTKQWLSQCKRILKANGSIWVIGGMQCIYTIGAIMQELGLWIINDIIWHKTNPTPNFKGTRLNNSHETLIWATKGKNSKYTFNYKTAKELNKDTVLIEDYQKGIRKQMGSVWRFPVCSGNERLKDENGKKLHSTQKPLELLQRIIAINSNVGDVVLDPFGGTMTTGVAAKSLGRNYIMIERDKKYCEYGKTRLDNTDYTETDISLAKFDEKPIRATMQEMIKDGYFTVDEWFYTKDGQAHAKLLSSGKLLYNGSETDMHTCIAKVKQAKADRLNGFNHWYVMRNSKLKSISEIREDFRKEKKQLSQ